MFPTMKRIAKKLMAEGYDYAVSLPSSRNYKSYLKNRIYLVLKDGLRGSVNAGEAFLQGSKERIREILACSSKTLEEAKKATEKECRRI